MVPFLDPSWRAFILGMHKQLPLASKTAGVNMVFPACMGLCTSPITMASTVYCLFSLLSALLWAHRAHASPSSGLFNLHLPVARAVTQSLLPFAQGLCDLACLPCALHPWTCKSEDNLDCSSWSCSQDLWLVVHLLGLHGAPARICIESSCLLQLVLPVPSLRCAPSLMLLRRISELMVLEWGPCWRFD